MLLPFDAVAPLISALVVPKLQPALATGPPCSRHAVPRAACMHTPPRRLQLDVAGGGGDALSLADVAETGSISGFSLASSSLPRHTNAAAALAGASGVGAAPQQQLVGLLSENRDLLDKLSAMHGKLKLTRARLAQREQELRSVQAEVSASSG